MFAGHFFFALIAAITFQHWVNASPATFYLCDPAVKQQNSTNIRIDVSDCDNPVPSLPPATEPNSCPLVKGTSHNFTILFDPNFTANLNFERTIVASFPTDLPGKPLEIPYGGNVNAGTTTKLLRTGELVQDIGLIAGETFVHNDLFPVLAQAPNTSLTVRYIIREKLMKKTKKRPNWKTHSGNTVICVEIPVTLVPNPNTSG